MDEIALPNTNIINMNIKHLVISGGGPSIFLTLGALQYLEENHFLDFDKIQSIYGTSAGAIIGVLVCLRYDWETLRKYMIERPWHEVFPVKIQQIFDAYTKKGIFDEQTIVKCFRPLLLAKNLDMNITLKELYEYSHIELHFYTFEINQYQVEDISYLTHPDLTLITAIQMTSALPVLMKPVCLGDKCYIDGGVTANYPLKWCIEGKNVQEVLGFRNQYSQNSMTILDSNSTLLEFVTTFLSKLVNSVSSESVEQPFIPYEIRCDIKHLSISYLKSALYSMTTREELYQKGIDTALKYLSSSVISKEKEPSSV